MDKNAIKITKFCLCVMIKTIYCTSFYIFIVLYLCNMNVALRETAYQSQQKYKAFK